MSASERAVPKGTPQEANQIGPSKDAVLNPKRAWLGSGSTPGLVSSIDQGVPSERVVITDITGSSGASIVYSAAVESTDKPDSPEKPRALYSGMQVVNLPERQVLDAVTKKAHMTWITDQDNSDVAQQADSIANSVGEIGGIEVLGRGRYAKDYDNRCQQFTFGTFFHEEWSYPFRKMPQSFFADTIDFLQENGYELIEKPDIGDVAVYVDSQNVLDEQVNHFGVLGPDGKIVAKLGQGPVVRHEIDTVPSEYGNYVFFLRKTYNTIVPTDPEGFEAYVQKIIQLYKSRDTVPAEIASDNSGILSSGMEIKDSLIRAEIDATSIQIVEEMNTEGIDMMSTYAEKLAAANIGKINELADSIVTVEGVEVLRKSDYGTENIYQRSCEYFTFGSMLREQWANSSEKLIKLADEYEQSDYLEQKGYVILEDEALRAGDVVAYTDDGFEYGGWGSPPFVHFGILTPDGKVVSRFGQGPIVRHAIDAVPSSYGNRVYFLRNGENTVIPQDSEGFESYLQQVLQEYQDRDLPIEKEENADSQNKIPRRVAFQAFNPKRTSQSAEKLLDVAKQIDSELQTGLIGNPYSHDAVRILTDRFADTGMSHPDRVRALVLAEQEGVYDKHMQQLSRDERRTALQKEFGTSAHMALQFSTYILDKEDDIWDMTDGEIYQNLAKEVFGTDDQEQINTQFSRCQRRNFRLAILNFIQNKNYLQQYRDEMETQPEETIKSVLKSAYDIEGDVEISGGFAAEVAPYGLLIYLKKRDYKKIVGDDSSGTVRSPDGDPDTIRGRLAVINLSGLHPTARNVQETRIHEVRHLLFNLFLDHTKRYTSTTTEQHLQQIHISTEKGSFEDELTEHREFAGTLRGYYTERGKDELIGNLTHTYDYLNPLDHLGATHFITHLDNIWEYLANRTDLTEDQRHTIYGSYHQKFVEYMEQTSFLQWTALKLYPAKGDTNSRLPRDQAEAMLQLTTPGTAARLGLQVGIEPDAMKSTFAQEQEEAIQVFSAQVDDAIAKYEQGRIGDMYNGWINVDKTKMDRFIGTFPVSLVPTLKKILENAPYALKTTTQLIKRAIDVLENIIQVHYQDMTKETLTGIMDSLDSVSVRNGPFRHGEAKKEAEGLKVVIEEYMPRRPDAQSTD